MQRSWPFAHAGLPDQIARCLPRAPTAPARSSSPPRIRPKKISAQNQPGSEAAASATASPGSDDFDFNAGLLSIPPGFPGSIRPGRHHRTGRHNSTWPNSTCHTATPASNGSRTSGSANRTRAPKVLGRRPHRHGRKNPDQPVRRRHQHQLHRRHGAAAGRPGNPMGAVFRNRGHLEWRAVRQRGRTGPDDCRGQSRLQGTAGRHRRADRRGNRKPGTNVPWKNGWPKTSVRRRSANS